MYHAKCALSILFHNIPFTSILATFDNDKLTTEVYDPKLQKIFPLHNPKRMPNGYEYRTHNLEKKLDSRMKHWSEERSWLILRSSKRQEDVAIMNDEEISSDYQLQSSGSICLEQSLMQSPNGELAQCAQLFSMLTFSIDK